MSAMLLYLIMLSSTDEDNTSPLTPDGNLTLVDDIGSSTESGQQFLTFVAKSGNTFYMIIGRNDKGEENVHFLNLVDEADLLTLMEEEDVSKYQAVEHVETETEETEEEDPVEPKKEEEEKSMAIPLILLFLAGIGGAGSEDESIIKSCSLAAVIGIKNSGSITSCPETCICLCFITAYYVRTWLSDL